jgi:hypothetical protein
MVSAAQSDQLLHHGHSNQIATMKRPGDVLLGGFLRLIMDCMDPLDLGSRQRGKGYLVLQR